LGVLHLLCSPCLKPPRGRVVRTAEGALPLPPVASSFALGLWEEAATGHSPFKGQHRRRKCTSRGELRWGEEGGKGEPVGVGKVRGGAVIGAAEHGELCYGVEQPSAASCAMVRSSQRK